MENKEKTKNLTEIETKTLVEELINREGVRTIIIDPYEKREINVEGPMIVLEIID